MTSEQLLSCAIIIDERNKRIQRLASGRALRLNEPNLTSCPSQYRDGKKLYCSFCGKYQTEVEKLIAGPSVYICDECVDLCVDIINEHKSDTENKNDKAN
ncbi:hypothetical protein FHD46_19995 [Escherichia coli]|nr:hypothetical protein [Escherichia coli]